MTDPGRAVAAVIFDMDGLLLDTEPLYRLASARAASSLGYVIADDLYARLVGHAAADVEHMLRDALGAGFPMAEFRERWAVQWQHIVERDGIPAKPGARGLLADLQAAGCPIGIATSTNSARARVCLAAAGVDGFHAVLVCGDQVSRGKPAPDIYLAAARALDRPPGVCVALEDSRPGVAAAHAAGMRVLMVPDLEPPGTTERARAWHVLANLDEARALLGDWL